MKDYTPSFTTALMYEIARERGYDISGLPIMDDYYVITFPDGIKTYGFQSVLNINTLGSWKVGKSKIATHGFLQKFGYSTISTIPLYQDHTHDEIRTLVQNLDMPFVIKPNTSSRAQGITVVKDYEQIPQALEHAWSFESHGSILAQPFIQGRHMRFMVLDNVTVLVYEKPAFWASDDIIAVDIPLHESYKQTIAQAVTDMGLRWSGVDVIISHDADVSQPITPESYTIVELNSAPTMKRFASMNDESYQRVKAWYGEILEKIQLSSL